MKTFGASRLFPMFIILGTLVSQPAATAEDYVHLPIKSLPTLECENCKQSQPCETCEKPKAEASDCDSCNPWAKIPNVRIFPRPGNFPIPPTGCGFHSVLDQFRGEAREKRRASPFIPFALTPYSMFDLNYSFLDKKDFNDPFPTDHLKRMRLGDKWLFSVGGQTWYRHMAETNSRLSGRNNSYELYRTRVYGDLWYKDQFRFFVEFIDAHHFDGDLPRLPIDENRSDLLNAFVDVKVAKIKDHPLYVRVGRQEMLLGSQRLISPLDWANTRRTFEGVRVFRQGKKFDVDAFWLRPVVVDPTHFDVRDNDRDFAGIFTTYRPKKGQFADLYYLFLSDETPPLIRGDAAPTPFDVHTIGSRWVGDRDGKFLWDIEGSMQFGSRGGQDIFAGAITTGAGYHFKNLPWKPVFWAYYDYASGDNNPNDGEFNTYNQLFPFGHYYLGWIDLVGRQNIHDINCHMHLYPNKWTSIWLQFHHFQLADTNDALFNAGGVALRRDGAGASGRNVGNEIDIVVNFHLARNTDLLIGYSHLFVGDFIERTAANASAARDANLFYTMISFRY